MRTTLRLVIWFASLGFCAIGLHGQIVVWSGGGDRFVTGSNWVGGIAPGAGDTAQFGPHGSFSTVLVNPTAVKDIDFVSTRTAVYTLDYDDGISLYLTLNGNINVQTGPNVVFTSNIDILLPSGAHVFTVDDAGTDLSIAGIMSSTGSLTKAGLGSVTLTGANTYTGGTTINSGTISVGSLANGGVASGIGASTNAAANLVLNGGTLQYTGAGVGTTDRLFTLGINGGTLDSSGSSAISFTNPGNLVLSGTNTARTLTLTGTLSDLNNFSPIIGDNGSGATSVVVGGDGQWILTAANTYSGGTTINANAALVANNATGSATGSGPVTVNVGSYLQIGESGTTGSVSGNIINNDAVFFQRNDAYSYGGVISGSGYVSANLIGTGTLTLGGVNTYTGITSIVNGTLSVASLADGSLASGIGASTNAASNLVLSGGTLQYTGVGASTDRLFTLGISGGTLDNSGSGAISFTNPGSLALTGTNTARTLTLTGTLQVFNGLSSIIGDNGSGATSLVLGGTSYWELTGANTYTGGTTINANAGLWANNATGSATGSGTVTVNSPGYLWIGSGGTTGSVSGNIINNNSLVFSRSDAIAYAGDISGSGYLAKEGAGTLDLSGSNTYTGVTRINEGTLSLSATTALPASGDVVVNNTAGGGTAFLSLSSLPASSSVTIGSLTFGGVGATSTSYNTVAMGGTHTLVLGGNVTFKNTNDPLDAGISGGTLDLGGATRTFNIADSANTATEIDIGSAITGTGAGLIKTGLGTLWLGGANTYDGGTTVNFGEIWVDGGSITHGAATTLVGNLSGDDASLAISNGGDVSNNDSFVGNSSSSTGAVSVNGAGSTWTNAGQIGIGWAGNGQLAITNGGTVSNTLADVGAVSTGYGIVFVDGSGSTWTNSSYVMVGNSGTGGLDITNGGTVTNTTGFISNISGSNGAVAVDGVGSNWTNTAYLYVGAAGLGTLDINSGGAVNSPNTSIGNNVGGSGAIIVSGAGSSLTNTDTLYVGSEGLGYLEITNGALATNVTGSVGNNAGGDGAVYLDTGGVWNNTGSLLVGNADNGSLELYGGSAVSAFNATIGVTSGTIGSVYVSGVGSTLTTTDNASNLTIGGAGDADLTIVLGGTVTTNGMGAIADGATSLSNVILDGIGSSWSIGSDLFIGNNGAAALRLYNGALLSVGAGTGTVTLAVSGGSGWLSLGDYIGSGSDAGILNAAAISTGVGNGLLTLASINSTQANPFYLTRDGTAGGIPVVISGATNVENSAGYSVLAGANTYTGGTVIFDGTLVAGSNSALGTGNVVLDYGALSIAPGVTITNTLGFTASGGTLGGGGTLGSNFTVGTNVSLSPGSSPGTLTFTNGLTLASGGTLDFEVQLANGTAGTDYDLLSISGTPLDITATSGSPFTLKVISLNGGGLPGAVSDFSSSSPYSWTIATSAAGITGFAANVFTINTANFTNSLGIGSFFLTQSGNNLLLNFTPVPEPSTYVLLSLGLGLFGLRFRRKRS